MARLVITLMDDPAYKQSSIRVAETLVRAGHKVTLVGRRLTGAGAPAFEGPGFESRPDQPLGLRRVRYRCVFRRGKAFYAEMNFRILLFLLFHHVDLVCAVNVDTMIPCWIASLFKRVPRVYDARELFTELPELVARPRIQRFWEVLAHFFVPRFPLGYAVCQSIADELRARYGVQYPVVRNMTVFQDRIPGPRPLEMPYLLYQGAVNHGRGMRTLLYALRYIDLPLVICGMGNLLHETLHWVDEFELYDKVLFTGQVPPEDLYRYTCHAFIGINLVEREGLNQYYCLPNKLFDYMHAGIPQVTMDFPEIRRVQDAFEIGVLIPEVAPEAIVEAVHRLQEDPALYERLRGNCLRAREVFNWQREEEGLLGVYRRAIQVNPKSNF